MGLWDDFLSHVVHFTVVKLICQEAFDNARHIWPSRLHLSLAGFNVHSDDHLHCEQLPDIW